MKKLLILLSLFCSACVTERTPVRLLPGVYQVEEEPLSCIDDYSPIPPINWILTKNSEERWTLQIGELSQTYYNCSPNFTYGLYCEKVALLESSTCPFSVQMFINIRPTREIDADIIGTDNYEFDCYIDHYECLPSWSFKGKYIGKDILTQ